MIKPEAFCLKRLKRSIYSTAAVCDILFNVTEIQRWEKESKTKLYIYVRVCLCVCKHCVKIIEISPLQITPRCEHFPVFISNPQPLSPFSCYV